MNPISIAFVRQRYAQDGGAERFVARTLQALKDQPVRVTLITREWQPADGVEVVVANPFYIGRLWRDWAFSRAVRQVMQKRHFDLVQSHERTPGCDIYRAGDGVHREWLTQRARVLSGVGRWLQRLNPYHVYTKCAERGVFTNPRLKAVICNSKMVRQEIQDYFGVPEKKLPVIYNGIDLKQFHPDLRQQRNELRARFGIPDDAPLFLFVGSGFERKGVAALLDAMAELPRDAFLLVVGRDRKSKRYQKRARRLGLAERVIFTGSQADVKPFYGAADALVLPTLYDPFPNVVLEAMASGLAVITSTKSGAAETVVDGESGFIGDALDRRWLAKSMLALCDRARALAFGVAARRRVESMGLRDMGEQLSGLYRTLTAPADGERALRVMHTESSLGWGGQEIRILTEIAGMIARGHEVTLLCPTEARIYEEAKLRGIPVIAMPIARKTLAGIRALRAWLKANPVDVVNTHSSVDTWLVAFARLRFKDAPPIVRTRHISAPIPNNFPTRWLYKRATRAIVTTGEALRRQLIDDNGYAAECIRSVPTGIDTAYFAAGDKAAARAKLNLPAGATIVGIVATLRSWKGHRYLLEAFARLSDKNARLLIVGDGPQREAIVQQAKELGLGERVIMPGNQRDVVPWMQSLDVFVLPSYANEGVPQALLQAMSCGLPVVSTPIGAITEAVEKDVSGLLVEPRNVESLHAALERMLGDAALRTRLAAAATRRVHERFSFQQMCDAMEAVFRQVSARDAA